MFPLWTLWGMGLSLIGALLILSLALFIQSPVFARRGNLFFSLRSLTGYAFALILLTIGFFVAGVPIGTGVVTPAAANLAPTPTSQFDNVVILPSPTREFAPEDVTSPPLTPITGAFGGPPPTATEPGLPLTTTVTVASNAAATATTPTVTAIAPTRAPSATPTHTPSPTPSRTPTPTPSPTLTPTPTWTPTPITGPTAEVNTDGSNLFVRRYPGGTQNLAILNDGDTVLLLPGRANQGGILWQEIRTLDGIEGWVQYQFLTFNQ